MARSDERECECDGPCHRLLPFDDLTPVAGYRGLYLCDECGETNPYVLDHLSPDRLPRDDDGPTPPPGDPGEAGRSDAA